MRASKVLLQHYCQTKEWQNAVRVLLYIMADGCEPQAVPRLQEMEDSNSLKWQMRSSNSEERSILLKDSLVASVSAAHGLHISSPPKLWQCTQPRVPLLSGTRWMSTGGISRKDYLWGISGSKQALQQAQSKGQAADEEEKAQEPDFFAQLEKEGYNNIQEALQRVIIGAYQLLQEDRVDQAESMVDEG